MVPHVEFCNMELIHVVLSSCFQWGKDSLSCLSSSHVHLVSPTGRKIEEAACIQQCYINRIQKHMPVSVLQCLFFPVTFIMSFYPCWTACWKQQIHSMSIHSSLPQSIKDWLSHPQSMNTVLSVFWDTHTQHGCCCIRHVTVIPQPEWSP